MLRAGRIVNNRFSQALCIIICIKPAVSQSLFANKSHFYQWLFNYQAKISTALLPLASDWIAAETGKAEPTELPELKAAQLALLP